MVSSHPRPSPASVVPAVLLLTVLVVGVPAQAANAPLPGATLLASPLVILRLANDPWEGGVWVGTEGGLLFKDLTTGQLRHYSVGQGLPSPVVNDIAVEPDRVWIATNLGVVTLDKQSQRLDEALLTDGKQVPGLCRTIFADTDGIWVGTDGAGLYRIDRSSRQANAVPNPENGSAFKHKIGGLGAWGDELYISAHGHGLVRWDRSTGQTWRYDDVQLQDRPYFGRIAVSEDEVWIGSQGDGALHLDRYTWKMSEFTGPRTTNTRAVFQPVKAFGSIWFPTVEGAAVYHREEDTWRSWNTVAGYTSLNDVVLADGELYGATKLEAKIVRYDRSARDWVRADWWGPHQTMGRNIVQSCEAEPTGLFAFGTGGGGAHLLDEPRARWSVIGSGLPDGQRIPDVNILDTAADAKTRFIAHHSGVTEQDLATGAFLHYRVAGRTNNDLQGSYKVRDIEMAEDDVWFSTPSTQGDDAAWHPGKVTRLNRTTHDQLLYGVEAGLTEGNVTVIELDGDRLWIGTQAGGLDVLDIPTGRITHAYGNRGQLGISDIQRTPDGLWLATNGQGVLRVHPQTFQATAVTGMSQHVPLSLHFDGARMWVGTYFGGLFEVNRGSMSATHYGAPGPLDLVVYCMASSDDILYMGTGWGVERFSKSRNAFLPQLMSPAGQAQPVLPDPHADPSTVQITSPAEGASLEGETVNVTGTSDALPGARVRVRIGDGAWVEATGLSSWSATLGLGEAFGETRITARLERNGTLLAQAFRAVTIGAGLEEEASTFGAVTFSHEPVHEAWLTEAIQLSVTPSRVPANLSTTVEVLTPDGSGFHQPMEVRDGKLVAALPPFKQAGEAAYRIRFLWDGGAARLPASYADLGTSYQLVVHADDPADRPRMVDPGKLVVRAGEEQEVQLVVQNPSARTHHLRVRLSGMEGVDATTENLTIGPGDSGIVVLEFRVPEGEKAARHELLVSLLPADVDLVWVQAPLEIVVATASGELPGSEGAPLPGWLTILALAFVAFRRRGTGP